MSMSTHVILLRDRNDPKHQKYVKVLESCREAGISLPKEIDDYFEGTYDPDVPLEIEFKPEEWGNDSEQGYEINLKDLPEGVCTIRFYNSY